MPPMIGYANDTAESQRGSANVSDLVSYDLGHRSRLVFSHRG
jgi:hypothetical protein